MATEDLLILARILADWAYPASDATIYLYGSRVRGDHRLNSDVDICVDWGAARQADLDWWTANNETDFTAINLLLPGKLEILEMNPSLKAAILAAPVIHQDRNVRCVLLPKSKGAIE